jgi:hypothetical protein
MIDPQELKGMSHEGDRRFAPKALSGHAHSALSRTESSYPRRLEYKATAAAFDTFSEPKAPA